MLKTKKKYTVKPAYVVTCIKESPALSSHLPEVPKYSANEPV